MRTEGRKKAVCPELVEACPERLPQAGSRRRLISFSGATEEKAGLRQAQPKREGEGGSSLRFAGYAAIFDRADRGGDIIRKGAFARTLAEGRHIPLLWQHERGHVIGRIETLEEDGRGLRVIARMEDGAPVRLAKGSGLSFGYRVRSAHHRTPAKAGVQLRAVDTGPRPSPGYGWRELIDLDLVEVSLVTIPMQPHARVHAVA